MAEEELQQLNKKDKIIKKHNVYVHTTEMTYPFANVTNMKAAWRATLETIGGWLEHYDKNIGLIKDDFANKIKDGFGLLEEEQTKIKNDLNEYLKLSMDEKIIKWKEQESSFVQSQKDYLAKFDDRKAEFELEMHNHMDIAINEAATVKAYRVKEAKLKRDALKLWDNAEKK